MLMYPPGLVHRSPHSFPECISDFAFAGWIPVIGELQKLLAQGEYKPLCPAPLFESNFLQVTKRGELVDVHNRASLVTLGIAATSPALLLPDVMIIARPTERPQGEQSEPNRTHAPQELELTRLIPLELVSLYLHDVGEQRLKLRLATGRVYYLQLCAPRGEERPLFARWLRLIYLLQTPVGSRGSASSWHGSDLHSHSAKAPTRQQLQPIHEEEEPGALMSRPGESLAGRSLTPMQGQLSGKQCPVSPRGQPPSKQSVGGGRAGCPAMPSTAAPVRCSPSTIHLDGLSRSQVKDTVSREQSQGSRLHPGGSSGFPSAERSHGQLSVAIPSGTHGAVGSQSHVGSQSPRGPSATSGAVMAPSSPERSRVSVGVGRSAVGTASVGVGHSLPSTASVAAGPSSAWPPGMDGQTESGGRASEKSQPQMDHASFPREQSGSHFQSQHESSAQSGPSKAAVAPSSHDQPHGSVAASCPEQATSPVAAVPPERSRLSVGVGPSEVATVSVAVGPSGQKSRSSSQVGSRSGKMTEESPKGKAQSSSGHTSKKRPSREKGSESKGKLKSALSSAKHRSSLTFVTLYSALSNSLDKVVSAKLSQRKSQEDAKTQLSSKSSKRVTISGVVEVSGQGSPEMNSMAPSSVVSKGQNVREQGPADSGTAPGRVSDQSSTVQPGGARTAAGPSFREKSTASVGVGRSAVAMASVAAGPSRPGSAQPLGMDGEMDPGSRSRELSAERSRKPLGSISPSAEQGRSHSRSPRRPRQLESSVVSGASRTTGSSEISQALAATGPLERSRVSVAAGPSERSRVSAAAGPSERSRVSVAAGPAGRSRVSAAAGPLERSRVSVATGPLETAGASMVPNSPEVSRPVASGSTEKSRASMGTSPSEMVAVSMAEQRSLSNAKPPGTDTQVSIEGRGLLSSLSKVSPGSAHRGRSREQSQGQAREKGGARSCSPADQPSQVPHKRSTVSVAVGLSKPAVVSVAVGPSKGPSGAQPSEMDRPGKLGKGSGQASVARSQSKGQQEDKQDPSVGHPASRTGSRGSSGLNSRSHSSYPLLLRLKNS